MLEVSLFLILFYYSPPILRTLLLHSSDFSHFSLTLFPFSHRNRDIRTQLSSSISTLHSTSPSFKPPHLLILQLGSSPASSTYIRMKLKAAEESGMTVEHIQVPSATTEGGQGDGEGQGVKEIMRLVKKANGDPKVNGLLVQLPLEGATPEEERKVVEMVGVEKDVDG